jgi:hypothetical protein
MANTKAISLNSISAPRRLCREQQPGTAPIGTGAGASELDGVIEKTSEPQATWSKHVLWINPPAHWIHPGIHPATACRTPKRH